MSEQKKKKHKRKPSDDEVPWTPDKRQVSVVYREISSSFPSEDILSESEPRSKKKKSESEKKTEKG